MRLLEALTALVQVEEHMAAYYEWAASHFAGDPEVRRCFETLAEQEREHASQLGLQLRLVRSGKLDTQVSLDRDAVRQLGFRIDTFMRQNRRPALPHVVLFALRLESSDIEQAYRDLVTSSVPELAQLAQSMIRADEKHAQMLREIMEKRRAAS